MPVEYRPREGQSLHGTTFARGLGRETILGSLKSDEHFVSHRRIDDDIPFHQQLCFSYK
jgi:hypothetical protein